MALVGRIPGKQGLTPEAAEALAAMGNDPQDTDSDAQEGYPNGFAPDELPDFGVPIGTPLFDDTETGDGIPDSRLHQKAEEPPEPRDAKPGIPSLDEWMDFFSRIVLRVACDWYIDWAFRGVDENSLTNRDIDRLQMTDAERQRIAVPFAELSHKSKLMRKHGRTIIASGGVMDAIIAIGTWTSRVNRIARRHKPVNGTVINSERTRQGEPQANGNAGQGANGGRFNPGVTIVNPGG